MRVTGLFDKYELTGTELEAVALQELSSGSCTGPQKYGEVFARLNQIEDTICDTRSRTMGEILMKLAHAMSELRQHHDGDLPRYSRMFESVEEDLRDIEAATQTALSGLNVHRLPARFFEDAKQSAVA